MAMIIHRIGTFVHQPPRSLASDIQTSAQACVDAWTSARASPGQRLGLALCATVPLIGVGGHAIALNAPEQEVIVRTLTAEQIRELTEDKTWIIDFDNSAVVSTTYYKVGGERFTERDGLVERLQWFIDEQADRRCVRSAFGSRCGYIVSFGSTLKICMQLNPLGDCSYTVARIISGDRYGLEQRARF